MFAYFLHDKLSKTGGGQEVLELGVEDAHDIRVQFPPQLYQYVKA